MDNRKTYRTWPWKFSVGTKTSQQSNVPTNKAESIDDQFPRNLNPHEEEHDDLPF